MFNINDFTENEVKKLFQCSNPGCQCRKSNGNVHCPCHDDENPSMTVNKNGKILVSCKAGCNQGDVFKTVCRIVNEKSGDNSNSSNSQNDNREKKKANDNHEKKKNVAKYIYDKSTDDKKIAYSIIKKYLKTRKIDIDNDLISEIGLKLNIHKKEQSIVYPIRNSQGDIVQIGQILIKPEDCTKIGKTEFKGTCDKECDRALIFNPGNKDCYIFEGLEDAISFFLFHDKKKDFTYIVTSSAVNFKRLDFFLSRFDNKILILDKDNGTSITQSECLKPHGVIRLLAKIEGIKDTNDALQQGRFDDWHKSLEEVPYKDEIYNSDYQETTEDMEENYKDKKFPMDIFPKKVKEFLIKTAESFQVDTALVASNFLLVVSASLGNGIILQAKSDLQEFPYLWLVNVGESGTGKTPVVQTLVKPIHKKQSEAGMQCHYFTNDSTTEALKKLLKSSPKGLLIHSDEILSLTNSLNQYKGGRGNDKEFFLTLHGCNSYKNDRKGQDKQIESDFINKKIGVAITGGLQPYLLPSIFTVQSCYDGFLARYLFTVSKDFNQEFIEDGLNDSDEHFYHSLIDKCYEIGVEEKIVLTFTEKAKKRFKTFFDNVDIKKQSELSYLHSFIKKMRVYVLRFCINLHVIHELTTHGQLTDNLVQLETVNDAIKLADFFLNQAKRIIKDTIVDDSQVIVMALSKEKEGLSITDLRNSVISIRKENGLTVKFDEYQFKKDLQYLIKKGTIIKEIIPTSGRSKNIYKLSKTPKKVN